jgi:hypothetical protein
MGIGDGDWGLGQSPIPNPQLHIRNFPYKNKNLKIKFFPNFNRKFNLYLVINNFLSIQKIIKLILHGRRKKEKIRIAQTKKRS